MKHDDLDAELKKLIYNLAETENPESLDMYFHAFKTIEKRRLNWFYKRLDELQEQNKRLANELIDIKTKTWYKRLFKSIKI